MRLAVFDPLDAGCPPSLDARPGDIRMRAHRQVGRGERRREKRGGRIAAPVPAQGELIGAEAFTERTVEVRVAREAGLHNGFDPRIAVRVVVAKIGDAQLSACAVELAFAACVVLRSAKVRQHIAIAPAPGTETLPIVEVRVLAADGQQSIDRTRPAQHLPAWPLSGPIARGLLRLHWKSPLESGGIDAAKVSDGQAQPRMAALASRFEEQDAARAVRAQAVGEQASGRPCADDHHLEFREFCAHLLGRFVVAGDASLTAPPQRH